MEEEINTVFKVSREKWKSSMLGVLWLSKRKQRGRLDSDPGFESLSDCLVYLCVDRLEIKFLNHAWVEPTGCLPTVEVNINPVMLFVLFPSNCFRVATCTFTINKALSFFMFYFTDQRNEKIVSYTRLLQNAYMNRNKAKLQISRTTLNSPFSNFKIILDEKTKSDDQGDFHYKDNMVLMRVKNSKVK